MKTLIVKVHIMWGNGKMTWTKIFIWNKTDVDYLLKMKQSCDLVKEALRFRTLLSTYGVMIFWSDYSMTCRVQKISVLFYQKGICLEQNIVSIDV